MIEINIIIECVMYNFMYDLVMIRCGLVYYLPAGVYLSERNMNELINILSNNIQIMILLYYVLGTLCYKNTNYVIALNFKNYIKFITYS